MKSAPKSLSAHQSQRNWTGWKRNRRCGTGAQMVEEAAFSVETRVLIVRRWKDAGARNHSGNQGQAVRGIPGKAGRVCPEGALALGLTTQGHPDTSRAAEPPAPGLRRTQRSLPRLGSAARMAGWPTAHPGCPAACASALGTGRTLSRHPPPHPGPHARGKGNIVAPNPIDGLRAWACCLSCRSSTHPPGLPARPPGSQQCGAGAVACHLTGNYVSCWNRHRRPETPWSAGCIPAKVRRTSPCPSGSQEWRGGGATGVTNGTARGGGPPWQGAAEAVCWFCCRCTPPERAAGSARLSRPRHSAPVAGKQSAKQGSEGLSPCADNTFYKNSKCKSPYTVCDSICVKCSEEANLQTENASRDSACLGLEWRGTRGNGEMECSGIRPR